MAKWIWIDDSLYPDCQYSFININNTTHEERGRYNYCVAEFANSFKFDKAVKHISLRVSGDTVYRLWLDGGLIGVGPASCGGDFSRCCIMPKHYADTYELDAEGDSFTVFAQVRLKPGVLTEFSRCHGGFYLEAEVVFADGSTQAVGTDEFWCARLNAAYNDERSYNALLPEEAQHNAVCVPDIWHVCDTPIPPLLLERLNPQQENTVTLESGETKLIEFTFDKIYAGYITVCGKGESKITVTPFELKERNEQGSERLLTNGSTDFISFRMYSVGGFEVTIENSGTDSAEFKFGMLSSCYPVYEQGGFESSDRQLNDVYDVCVHTLKICRQSLHLDSPKHQELLACTGDYYIESLMTAFTFGDMRLAKFDVMRTADWLTHNNGVMFHTTYSLIWVQMLYDVYRFTGDRDLLVYCRKALETLLNRFESYTDKDGIIQNPPDYMFVDWVVTQGYSMHHPPKALGQTVLNAFYYGVLKMAEKIFVLLKDSYNAKACFADAARLKSSFVSTFYDRDKQLFFDGLTGKTPTKYYLPENPDIKNFSRYPNVLAVLYGIVEGDEARQLLIRTLDSDLPQVQPYFMHFVLEAVDKTGLFAEYGMKLLDMWKPLVEECSKGLKEGWFAPQKDYSFDHSHAWGGTPAYQLPSKLLGFKLLKPGFEEIELSPRLYGLEYAKITMPTPYGFIVCEMRQGEASKLTVPKEIKYTLA